MHLYTNITSHDPPVHIPSPPLHQKSTRRLHVWGVLLAFYPCGPAGFPSSRQSDRAAAPSVVLLFRLACRVPLAKGSSNQHAYGFFFPPGALTPPARLCITLIHLGYIGGEREGRSPFNISIAIVTVYHVLRFPSLSLSGGSGDSRLQKLRVLYLIKQFAASKDSRLPR